MAVKSHELCPIRSRKIMNLVQCLYNSHWILKVILSFFIKRASFLLQTFIAQYVSRIVVSAKIRRSSPCEAEEKVVEEAQQRLRNAKQRLVDETGHAVRGLR